MKLVLLYCSVQWKKKKSTPTSCLSKKKEKKSANTLVIHLFGGIKLSQSKNGGHEKIKS